MATSNKYDRQLRLWGASGQAALSGSNVILINASAAGTETLKNLVLPGIGSFHVLDDESMASKNNANGGFSNFFVFEEEDCKMESRAEVACHYLSELNPDVEGRWSHIPNLHAMEEAALAPLLLQSTNNKKSIVIVADVPPDSLLRIANVCDTHDIPCLHVKAYGLIGLVRIQTKSHVIVEARPDNSVPDLRLTSRKRPIFPQLQSLADDTDLDSLDKAAHGHVPYVILLIKALQRWRLHDKHAPSKHDLLFPSTMEEKNQFKELIRSMSRNFDKELNFQEAHRNAYLAYAERQLPWEVQQLLDAPIPWDQTNNPTLIRFHILLSALHHFMRDHDGDTPLHGSIPDMASATTPYIALQQAYQSKANHDLQKMQQYIQNILTSRQQQQQQQQQQSPSSITVSTEQLTTFCKNVLNLRSLTTRSLSTEWNDTTTTPPPPQDKDGDVTMTADPIMDEDIRSDLLMATFEPADVPHHTPLLWMIALRAAEYFHSQHKRYPGTTNDWESDVPKVQHYIQRIYSNMGLQDNDLVQSTFANNTNHAEEIVRYANAEIHSIAAILGGVASQEAVKLITEQYVPLDNTYVYNGIAGTAAVYRF